MPTPTPTPSPTPVPISGTGIWTRNGPIDIKYTDGRYDKIVDRGLVVDSSNGNIAYAGSDANGIYKTTNGGASWTNVYHSGIPFVSRNPTAIAIHPTNPNTFT